MRRDGTRETTEGLKQALASKWDRPVKKTLGTPNGPTLVAAPIPSNNEGGGGLMSPVQDDLSQVFFPFFSFFFLFFFLFFFSFVFSLLLFFPPLFSFFSSSRGVSPPR